MNSLGWKQVRCKDCGHEYQCTPYSDYYVDDDSLTFDENDVAQGGQCETCLLTSAGIKPVVPEAVEPSGIIIGASSTSMEGSSSQGSSTMLKLIHIADNLRQLPSKKLNGVMAFILLGLMLIGTAFWMNTTDNVGKLLAIGWLAFITGIWVIRAYGFKLRKR